MATDRGARIVTLPNLISLLRLACVPVFVWLLVEDELLAAAGLLAVLGATDWVDGWIARRFDQGSELGKILDPTADRVLLLVAAIALMVQGSVPLWVGVLVLGRELVVSVAALLLAAAGARRIDVQWVGKAGTLALMFAFPLFLWADAIHGDAHDFVLAVAWFFTVTGLALSYYAAVHATSRWHDGRSRRDANIELRTARAARTRRGVWRDEGRHHAGGEGTRLRPLTSNSPKPMMPLANKPMMEHIVNLLAQHGFDEVVVTVAFLANQIRDYFGDGSDFGVTHAVRHRRQRRSVPRDRSATRPTSSTTRSS